MTTDLEDVTAASFWKALAGRTAGVAVVSAQGSEGPMGFLALSVTHLTAAPPTLLISMSKTTSAAAAIIESGSLAVNYLRGDLAAVADVFSGKTGLKGPQRFDHIAWHSLSNGAPALDDAISVLGCDVIELIERYDTFIVIAALKSASNRPGSPLIHFGGRMISLTAD